jgi:hypothetical protein
MWTIEVPDTGLDICSSLYKILRRQRKTGRFFRHDRVCADGVCAGASDRRNDGPVQVEAGVEGLLHAYAVLLKANANDREQYLDKLMKTRDEGTLKKFLKSHTASGCDNRGSVFSSDEGEISICESTRDALREKLLTIFPLFVRFFLDTCEA